MSERKIESDGAGGPNVQKVAMIVSSAPASRPPRLVFAVMFLAIVLAVGGLNARYLFQAEIYEHGDLASNSLAIREAKGFRLLHGQYSRWGFHHPGPGLFYVEAAGEALFYDMLHLVPTPWNAQLLTMLLVNAGFLAAALAVVARWGGGWVTAGIGLVILTLHLAALGAGNGLMFNWQPFVMAPPFTCLVLAAASVAAGRGKDLPLLALSGSALLNTHVAQPLFVVPLSLLAYAGLLWQGKGKPWRLFPRAHVLVAGIVLLTALPVVIDATRGAESNLALIQAHRHGHQGKKHPLGRAFFYCLRFAGYKPSVGPEDAMTGRARVLDIMRYVGTHAGIFSLWTAATGLLVLGAVRSRFGAYLLTFVALTGGLTVYWAAIQDGDMFYFNGWFNYGLLVAAALGAVGVAAGLLTARFPSLARSPGLAVGITFLVAGALFGARTERFRGFSGDDEPSRNLHRSVGAALAIDETGRGKIKHLILAHDEWEDGVGVALDLTRRGERFRVSGETAFIFGRPAAGDPLPLEPSDTANVRIWRVLPPAADSRAAAERPLFHGSGLSLTAPVVDPGAGTSITFSGPAPNATAYVLGGWSGPAAGDPFTWTDGNTGRLSFHAAPVPADGTVEITVDAFPALTPGKVEAQRAELLLNGVPVGAWTARDEEEPLRAQVSGSQWNNLGEAMMTWRFPDATSPAQLGTGPDRRVIGFGFRQITFGLRTGPVEEKP